MCLHNEAPSVAISALVTGPLSLTCGDKTRVCMHGVSINYPALAATDKVAIDKAHADTDKTAADKAAADTIVADKGCRRQDGRRQDGRLQGRQRRGRRRQGRRRHWVSRMSGIGRPV